ncbi:MAG: preprotein translocase subunit YajC [Parachlamydiales bacterium]|nr:preprotein translocase subunit YajC [Parachlamydiales bacterium]
MNLFSTISFFADNAQSAAKSGGYMQTLIMLAVALVFFYFILLRPEQKRRKQAKYMRDSMKKGDKVTAMGMIGTIDQVTDNTVILNTYDGAKIEVLKAAITDVQTSTPVEKA